MSDLKWVIPLLHVKRENIYNTFSNGWRKLVLAARAQSPPYVMNLRIYGGLCMPEPAFYAMQKLKSNLICTEIFLKNGELHC